MDVTIRVQAIRQFATQQMALLIDNSAVIMHRYPETILITKDIDNAGQNFSLV